MVDLLTPEELIDASKPLPIPAVQIFWSREHRRYLAVAPAVAGFFGLGETFTEAARALEDALAHYAESDRAGIEIIERPQ